MKTAAVICEFNPFHNGHKYLTDEIRKNGITHIAAIMGGSFLQRGNAAVADKWSRAKAAVMGGVDLVLELPQIYACACAERFAYGACATLDKCGCIDTLAFGSECGDIVKLQSAANENLNNRELSVKIKNYQKQGMSYPRAVSKAFEEEYGKEIAAILNNPNDTLGLEYIKALNVLNSSIEPFCVKRIGAFHDSLKSSENIASATAVRNLIFENNISYRDYVPKTTSDILESCISQGIAPASFKNNERGVLTVLRKMNADDFLNLPDVSDGLENRIEQSVKISGSMEELLSNIKCKRYTHARITRIITNAYLGIDKRTSLIEPKYIRVLAFNEKGAEILKEFKKKASLPVVVSPAKDSLKLDDEGKLLLNTDIRTSDLYSLLTDKVQVCGLDYYKSVIKI